MGRVPDDPRAAVGDGSPQFDASDTDLAAGDVLGMIDWAMTRLGTPYSQCLGVEARPQDPECPPGTNRFGAGFFDCSGFVSNAYRRIGIVRAGHDLRHGGRPAVHGHRRSATAST